jgi:gluconate kinase
MLAAEAAASWCDAVGQDECVGALIVVTGPPGAGKSTVARLLADRFDPSALVAGDEFFGFIASGRIDPWLPESREQNESVIQAAAAAAGRLALGGYTVVYDGVLGPWFVGAFLAGAGVGAIHYVSLMPTEERCRERVRTRTDHGFTDLCATSKMYGEFERWPLEARHVILDEGSAAETADEVVRRLVAGQLEWTEPSA